MSDETLGQVAPRRPRLVVVGSSNTDLVVATSRIPAPGETVVGGELRRVPGGKGANQAVAAARLGAEVVFLARVGDDAFGADARAAYSREGIDTRYVLTTPDTPSGVALIAVDAATGENSILVAPGANARLTPEDIDAAAPAFADADLVVLSLEIPLETALRAAQIGAQQGKPVLLNPAPARALPPELLANIALLTPNETEAQQIAGLPASDDIAPDYDALAAALLQTGIDAAIITLGSAGALLATADGIEHHPARPARALDTVGAGDCFTAALAVEVARGHSLRDAVRFANAAAALKVTRWGAQAGMPTRAEVESFLGRG